MDEMDACPMRAEAVRGMSRRECRLAGMCWMCGEPIAPTRRAQPWQRPWCSRRATKDRPTCSQTFWRHHGWSWARFEALRRSKEEHGRVRCVRCGSPNRPEVNHIIPRNGAGYGDGCHHHQSNLEVLCHACHVEETKRQRRERSGQPVRADQVTLW